MWIVRCSNSDVDLRDHAKLTLDDRGSCPRSHSSTSHENWLIGDRSAMSTTSGSNSKSDMFVSRASSLIGISPVDELPSVVLAPPTLACAEDIEREGLACVQASPAVLLGRALDVFLRVVLPTSTGLQGFDVVVHGVEAKPSPRCLQARGPTPGLCEEPRGFVSKKFRCDPQPLLKGRRWRLVSVLGAGGEGSPTWLCHGGERDRLRSLSRI